MLSVSTTMKVVQELWRSYETAKRCPFTGSRRQVPSNRTVVVEPERSRRASSGDRWVSGCVSFLKLTSGDVTGETSDRENPVSFFRYFESGAFAVAFVVGRCRCFEVEGSQAIRVTSIPRTPPELDRRRSLQFVLLSLVFFFYHSQSVSPGHISHRYYIDQTAWINVRFPGYRESVALSVRMYFRN